LSPLQVAALRPPHGWQSEISLTKSFRLRRVPEGRPIRATECACRKLPRKRRVLDDPVQECRVADLVARSGGTTTPSTPTSTSWKVKVSSWAFDLVSRMLNIDPSERVLLMSLLRTLSCLQEQRARLSWGLQSCHSDESPLECSAYQQARLRVPRQFVCSSLLWTFACSRS
jgi:hypothetical protein